MITVLCSAKGAPGVTTAATALALQWPRDVLLVELDMHGGDLAWRLSSRTGAALSPDVGAITLATGVGASSDVMDHVQLTDGNLQVLIGPRNVREARAITRWDTAVDKLAALPMDVIIDGGRVVSDTTPLAPALRRADQVWVMSRCSLADVAHLRTGMEHVMTARASQYGCAALLVADKGARRGQVVHDVAGALDDQPALRGAEVVGVLPHDQASAGALAGERSGNRIHRKPLMKAARTLAGTLLGRDASRELIADQVTEPTG